jgi:hypothetical protein
METLKELKRLMLVLVVFWIVMLPLMVLAQDAALDPDQDIGAVLTFFAQAFQGGQYWVVGATAIMIVVWAVAKWFIKDALWLAFLAPVVGVLGSCAVELAKPDVDIGNAIYTSFTASGPATLMWSAFGKLIFSKDSRAKFADKVRDRRIRKAKKRSG